MKGGNSQAILLTRRAHNKFTPTFDFEWEQENVLISLRRNAIP